MQCKCIVCKAARSLGESAPGCASKMKLEFLAHLNRVRERVYGRPMPISSGYRCEHHPIEARKRKQAEEEGRTRPLGDHSCGVGVDVLASGRNAHDLMQALHVYNWLHIQEGLPQPFTAICPDQRGLVMMRFIHIGSNTEAPGRPRPWLWTY
ncbi:hypothetical protein ACJJIE_00125 (plasmid) [Microbulbifer sp. TRSA001]|uniref:hypothetical protein n=1 Tax=Microbulbifer sp. TRSA001 TaxID=3243381 RepID=UPI004039777A